MHTNKITQGKKDEIIKKYRNFIENKFANRKLEKRGVVSPCHERLWIFYIHIFFTNVRYFSNLKLVFKNKYVVSFPSFNDSLVSFQSDKYF